MVTRPDLPQLRELRGVIPVGQAQTHGAWTLTCLTVECYEDGFKPTFRVFGAGCWPCDPQLALVASDDQDGEYHHWGSGGNGAANFVDCDWRLAHVCAPALDPQARELRLTITEVGGTEYDEATRSLRVTQRYPGPWVFTIPLPPPA